MLRSVANGTRCLNLAIIPNSFRRGEFKVVRSLVYEESYGNYPFVALVSCSQPLSLLGYATDAF